MECMAQRKVVSIASQEPVGKLDRGGHKNAIVIGEAYSTTVLKEMELVGTNRPTFLGRCSSASLVLQNKMDRSKDKSSGLGWKKAYDLIHGISVNI